MHFRDIVAAHLQPHHRMAATLGQEHTAHLRIGPWPILIAAAPKGQHVGFRLGSVKDRAMAITNSTRAKAVLARTRRALVDQGSLCSTHRSITALGYTSLSIVMLTCSHTLSSTSSSRNLYIESSLFFCFLVVCQIGAFLSSLSPFWLK